MLILMILPVLLSVPILQNKLFVKGELVDAGFHLIPARSRSCWRGLVRPPPVEKEHDEEDEEDEEEDEEESQEGEPHANVNVPILQFPMQGGASGSSNGQSHLLE